ncbi:MAG: hypothetical protein RRX93_04480 [Bacteroidales bacterium]
MKLRRTYSLRKSEKTFRTVSLQNYEEPIPYYQIVHRYNLSLSASASLSAYLFPCFSPYRKG